MNWSAWWLTWLIAIIASFAIPEGIAIKRKQKGDTLTENIRLWLQTDTPGGGASWLIVWSTLLTVLCWLLGHILEWWP